MIVKFQKASYQADEKSLDYVLKIECKVSMEQRVSLNNLIAEEQNTLLDIDLAETFDESKYYPIV